MTVKSRQITFAHTLCLMLVLAAAFSSPARGTQRVSTTTLSEVLFSPVKEAPAEVLSLNDGRLSAEVSARVIDIPTQVGDVVEPGNTLIKLNARDFDLKLAAAQAEQRVLKARLGLARNQLRRVSTLRKSRSASEELVNTRQAEMDSLKAQMEKQQTLIDAAKLNLENCTIRSPFRALVVEILTSIGELATPGADLIRVIDVDTLELRAFVQAADTSSLQQAKNPSFVAFGLSYPLQLRTVVPLIDPRARSREARLLFTTTSALPGATGRLTWEDSRPHLPPHYLVRRDGKSGIFLLDGDHVRFHRLPQAQEGRPVPVMVDPSTEMVVDGRFTVSDGDTVITE